VGCARRLGCLVGLAGLVGLAWVTRDRWTPWLPSAVGGTGSADASGGGAAPVWGLVTPGGASHAEHLILGLGQRPSPPYTQLLPADFAAYLLMDISGRIPPAADSTRAAIVDQRLALRTVVDVDRLGGRAVLGPLATVIGKREPLSLAGTVDVVRPGVGEFRVEELRIHDLPVPSALIPQLIHRIENGAHPPGIAQNGLLLNVPPYVADIRIARGRVAVYGAAP